MNHRYRGPEPIEVTKAAGGEPAAFRWRGRRYAVRAIVATWVEAMPWWVDRASGRHRPLLHEQRLVWRVEAASWSGTTGVYDLYRAPCGWGLERVID